MHVDGEFEDAIASILWGEHTSGMEESTQKNRQCHQTSTRTRNMYKLYVAQSLALLTLTLCSVLILANLG